VRKSLSTGCLASRFGNGKKSSRLSTSPLKTCLAN
jgi:hypothetical protein